jgi:hypothetical protein
LIFLISVAPRFPHHFSQAFGQPFDKTRSRRLPMPAGTARLQSVMMLMK